MIEIDGVCRRLERPAWESGDYISDVYSLLIDLTTSTDILTEDKTTRIASCTRRLNRNLGTTSALLVGSEFADPYDDVVRQINELNADIEGAGILQTLIRNDTRFEAVSGSIKFG